MGEVAAPPLPSSPYTRKLSGPHARMSDAWVSGLVFSLLLSLLAGLQQVSAWEVKLLNLPGLPLWHRGLLLKSGHHLPLSGFPRDHTQLSNFLSLFLLGK